MRAVTPEDHKVSDEIFGALIADAAVDGAPPSRGFFNKTPYCGFALTLP